MSWGYDQWRNEGAGAPRRSKGWGPYVQTAKLKTYSGPVLISVPWLVIIISPYPLHRTEFN